MSLSSEAAMRRSRISELRKQMRGRILVQEMYNHLDFIGSSLIFIRDKGLYIVRENDPRKLLKYLFLHLLIKLSLFLTYFLALF